MKKALRILGLLIVVAACVYWAVAGANTGWTKNKVQVKTVDEVTGIEDIQWKAKFVPGIDFLGAAFGGACVLAGVSFFFRSKKTGNQQAT